MGGPNFDLAEGVALDDSGNVHTVGSFSDTVDFDPGPGTFNLTSMGSTDIFVSKLGPTPANQAPIADAGPDQVVTVAPGDTAMVTLDGSGSSDPDGDPLTFTWTDSFGTAMGVMPTVTLGPGVHTITLTVDDGRGGMDTDTVEITVNQAPIANAGPDQLVTVAPGGTAMVTLDGSGSSDPDGDPLTFTWTNAFGAVMGATPTVTLGPGVHTVSLTVDDGRGGMDSDTVEITVNQAPIADAGPDQRVSTGDNDRVRVTLDGSGSSDPDGDPLTFTWTGPFGTLSGMIVTPVLKPGTHNITLTVADGKGGMDTDTVQISVSDGRPPKIIVSPRSLTFMLDETSAPSTASARLLPARQVDAETASKPFTLTVERGPVNFRILPGGSWLRTDPNNGQLVDGVVQQIQAVVDPTGLPAGTYTAPLLIRTGSRIAARLDVTLVITPRSAPPPSSPPIPKVLENGVVNAASLIPFGQPGHPMAPGSMVSIFGSNFTDNDHFEAETVPLPIGLGEVSVTLNGESVPLYGVWPDQINIQLSWELLELLQELNTSPVRRQQRIPTATLVVTNAAGSSASREIQLGVFSPAIFTVDVSGSGQGVVTFANTAALAAPLGVTANSRPAKESDLLTIYANGLGPVEPPILDGFNSCDPAGQCLPDFSDVVLRHTTTRPVVTIGGVVVPNEDVLFSGLSVEFVGLNVATIRVPAGIAPGNAVPIVIRIDELESRGDVTLAIE